MLETWSKEALIGEVESLAQIAAHQPPVARDAGYWARIEKLRDVYRGAPSLFDPSLVKWIRRLAQGIRTQESPQSVLESVFGYDAFRAGQEEIIQSVLAGRDCVGVMPTGAGKSLTYQIPARILKGLTVVISPLISLMKDQVDALTEVGIRSAFINSSLDADERRERIGRLMAGHYDLVYVAPEGLDGALFDLLLRCEINLIAIDEAHCISQWGHDFRPSYRNLSGLKKQFGHVPVLALTATATDKVMDDIVEQMDMSAPFRYRGSFFRSNLRLHAYKKGKGRNTKRDILRLIQSRKGQSGIVYCLSRKGVEKTAAYLGDHGIRVMPYHAGMEHERRLETQEAFRRDDIEAIVATVAFGMGIDKPNVRYVIHRDMPKSIDGYYQEIGRSGRDGVGSDCILFYSWSEVIGYERFLVDLEDAELKDRIQQQTRAMFRLAEKEGCRHQALVAYFGETIPECESACDRCRERDLLEEIRSLEKTERRPKPKVAQGESVDFEGSEKEIDEGLLDRLKQLRKRLADEKKIPAYLVFSDAALLQMAIKLPQTESAFLEINGVGPKKLAAYGPFFLGLLREVAHTTGYPSSMPPPFSAGGA
ncbi:MAG: RecQ family ATP-dependent DNA helicase [Nitrospiria bacterium]